MEDEIGGQKIEIKVEVSKKVICVSEIDRS